MRESGAVSFLFFFPLHFFLSVCFLLTIVFSLYFLLPPHSFQQAKHSKKGGSEAGEAIKVKGVKIHAKKSKGGEAAEAAEAAPVKHTPKKTAEFAEEVAKKGAKKTKGGVSSICFRFFFSEKSGAREGKRQAT